jgi:hypothetical protein
MTDPGQETALREAFDLLTADGPPRSLSFEKVAGLAAARRRRRFAAVAVSVTASVAVVVVGSAAVAARQRPLPSRPVSHPPVVAAPCPERHPVSYATKPLRVDLRPLVPAGAAAATGCRYLGLNQVRPAGTLVRSVTVPRDAVGQLVAAMNAAPRLPPGAVRFCAVDFGERVLVLFSYRTGPVITVEIDIGGCAQMTSPTGVAERTPQVTALLPALFEQGQGAP